MWSDIDSKQSSRREQVKAGPPPARARPAESPGEAAFSSSARVAAALVARARALRSLEARVVCSDLGGVPPARQDELQYAW